MKYRRVIRNSIIIGTFFLSTIECRTDIIATNIVKRGIDKLAATELDRQKEQIRTVKLFSGDILSGEITYTTYSIQIQSNETEEQLLTRLLKAYPAQSENAVIGIPGDAVIVSITLNALEDYVIINMSKTYDLSAYGSTEEYLTLQSLISTVANYYSVDKAILQVEGKPYSSGHFSFEDNQTMGAAISDYELKEKVCYVVEEK